MEASRRHLLEQISEEERLIRIHQAELALQRQARQESLTTRPLVENVEEQDWLETLDALQSSSSQTLESRAQDDPAIHRLLPLVGGMTFTSVRALEPNSAEDTTRSYQFQGNVKSQVSFTVTAKVELLDDRASVVSLEANFGTQSKELGDISRVASETCCIPLMFRLLATWTEFDARRTALLLECQEKCNLDAVKLLSKETFALQILNSGKAVLLSLSLMWTWKCSRYERGKEELSLVACNISPDVRMDQSELVQCVREIQNPQGLNDLVVSAGSCEKALRLLVQVLLGL